MASSQTAGVPVNRFQSKVNAHIKYSNFVSITSIILEPTNSFVCTLYGSKQRTCFLWLFNMAPFLVFYSLFLIFVSFTSARKSIIGKVIKITLEINNCFFFQLCDWNFPTFYRKSMSSTLWHIWFVYSFEQMPNTGKFCITSNVFNVIWTTTIYQTIWMWK